MTAAALRLTPWSMIGGRRALRLLERNILVYRRSWIYIVSGFFEPLFYLLSIGFGLNKLVGGLRLGHTVVRYTAFVAPGLLASSAMNGAVIDATFNVFFKLRIAKTYEAILSTPMGVGDVALGELLWCMLRSGLYSAAFLIVMSSLGLALSPWVVLCFPAALLTGFAFASVGMAATTFMRSWQDFDMVSLAIMPMFLFSATFYPLSVYPGWLQAVVRYTPLYQGVAMVRDLDAGALSASLAAHAAYLAVLGVGGLATASRRFGKLLTP